MIVKIEGTTESNVTFAVGSLSVTVEGFWNADREELQMRLTFLGCKNEKEVFEWNGFELKPANDFDTDAKTG